MTGQPLSLALLETAPDRQTAKLALLAALHSNVSPDQLRASWNRWERENRDRNRRGEV